MIPGDPRDLPSLPDIPGWLGALLGVGGSKLFDWIRTRRQASAEVEHEEAQAEHERAEAALTHAEVNKLVIDQLVEHSKREDARRAEMEARFMAEIEASRARNRADEAEIAKLRAENQSLKAEVARLRARVAELERRGGSSVG